MLPQINGKDLLSCDENDLSVLIENSDYRENDYLDYKQSFSFLEMEKGKEREAKKIEFKIDVCSFANTDGGYLIYGISEQNGCVTEIEGIDIPNDNTDRFELDRRNDLAGIQPKIPSVQFHFIKLKTGRYVVVLYIKADGFSPYIYLEDEKNYKIYNRSGNRKNVIGYNELRQMFNRSFSLEQSITGYRKERILYYSQLGESFGKSYAHLCIIPETFVDPNYRKNMYALSRVKNIAFDTIFSELGIVSSMIPCVDGIRFVPISNDRINSECYVKNNGIVEVCLSLDKHLYNNREKYPDGFLPWEWLWRYLKNIVREYVDVFKNINTGERVYIGLSIVGCRNIQTEERDLPVEFQGRIDRDEVICDLVDIIRLNDTEYEKVMKKLYISYLLAIGIQDDRRLNALIDEVYG